jgi:hypothetical protein
MTGSIFYRLCQVDYDGTTTLSKEIEVSFNSTPTSFELSQNYPNPFNPSTVIKYAINKQANVNLSIYNVLGQKVIELVNSFQNAGTYEVNFNASSLSSGIYIYSLSNGSNLISKKMLLLK